MLPGLNSRTFLCFFICFLLFLRLARRAAGFLEIPTSRVAGSVLRHIFQKRDKSLLEAADDLGASRLHVFTRVVLPLTMPGIFAGSIQTFIPSLGFFFISDMMGGAKTMYIGNLIKNQFLSARNWQRKRRLPQRWEGTKKDKSGRHRVCCLA